MGIIDAVFVESLELDTSLGSWNQNGGETIEWDKKREKVMIIEIKTSINYEAIAQIIVYKYLFPKIFPFVMQWIAI